MPHAINDDCTTCGACEAVCPTEAIKAGEPKFIIDPEKCTDCAECVNECPTEAIAPVEE